MLVLEHARSGCRLGTYASPLQAVHLAAQAMGQRHLIDACESELRYTAKEHGWSLQPEGTPSLLVFDACLNRLAKEILRIKENIQ